MTDSVRLNELIKKSGLKIKFIAEKLGITAQGLSSKRSGKSEFTASEISTLAGLLNLSQKEIYDIFLSKK